MNIYDYATIHGFVAKQSLFLYDTGPEYYCPAMIKSRLCDTCNGFLLCYQLDVYQRDPTVFPSMMSPL